MPKNSPSVVRQVPLREAEHGLAHAVGMLKVEPDEISSRRGVRFETGRDDLDEFEAAVICTPAGRQFGLQMHRHQPARGTVILINERSQDWGEDLREVLQLLQLDWQELSWIHPEITAARLA